MNLSDDYRAGAIAETAHSGQHITANLLKSAALAAGQIREEIVAIKATAAATSDDDLGSPMIRGHAPVPDAIADAEPALPEPALLSPPLDLREPASPFVQVASGNTLPDSSLETLPSGEQQAPPKPCDDSEGSPQIDSHYQAAQRSKLADSLHAESTLGCGRLEERLNECVLPQPQATNDDKKEGPRPLRGPARGTLATGVDSKVSARSKVHLGSTAAFAATSATASSSRGARPRRIRASVQNDTPQSEEAALQRQELIARMQQANQAMRRIRRPVRKGPTVTVTSKALHRPTKPAAEQAPPRQPPAPLIEPFSRAAHTTRGLQKAHHGDAVQTHISLSALLVGGGGDRSAGAGGGAAVSVEKVPETGNPPMPVAESLFSQPKDIPALPPIERAVSDGFVTPVGSPVKQPVRRKVWGQAAPPEQTRTPLSSPVKQATSSKVLEALAAAAAATAAQQSAASSLKERLAAVASAATSARKRSTVTTPRKGSLPASPTKATGDVPTLRLEFEEFDRLDTPLKGSDRTTCGPSSGAGDKQGSDAASGLQVQEPAEGVTQGGPKPQPVWPKPLAPAPTWNENPGPELPEGYTTPRRNPLRRAGAAFLAQSPMVGASPTARVWPWSRAASIASDATSDSTPQSKDVKQKPYTPAGAKNRRWEEPPSSSKRCRPSPASPSEEEGDEVAHQDADKGGLSIGLFPDDSSVRQGSPVEDQVQQWLPDSHSPAATTPPTTGAGFQAGSPTPPLSDGVTEGVVKSGYSISRGGEALQEDKVRNASPLVEATTAEGESNAMANATSVVELKRSPVKGPEMNQQRLKRQSSARVTGLISRWSRRKASASPAVPPAAEKAGVQAPPPLSNTQLSPSIRGSDTQAAVQEGSMTPDEDVLAAILGCRPSRALSDQCSPSSPGYNASTPVSAPAVDTCREFPTPSSLGSFDLEQAASGVDSISLRGSSLSSPFTRSEISLRRSWGTQSLQRPGLRGSGSSATSGSLSRLGGTDLRSSGTSLRSGISRRVTISPGASAGQGGRPGAGPSTGTSRGKGGNAPLRSNLRSRAPLEVAKRVRKPWNMSVTLQTSESETSQHSRGSPSDSAGDLRRELSPASHSRGGLSVGSPSGDGTSMAAAASGSVWGPGGGMSDSPESVRGGGGWSCGSPITSGGGSSGHGGGSAQDLPSQGRSGATMKEWTKMALTSESRGKESPNGGGKMSVSQSMDFSPLQNAAGGTVGHHPLGCRLLHERPGLRVAAAADLLAEMEAGLSVHKAWIRSDSCAASGSQRTLQVRVEAPRVAFAYCSGVMRRPRTFDVISVHINDEERYIQVGTQDGEQMLLKPKTSESYALWVLGLNAALACARGASVPTEIINNMPWAL